MENLFNGNLLSRVALNKIDQDYYKSIKTKSAFNNNYIEYESKDEKNKNLSPKEYPDIIKFQLAMQINFISSKDSEETMYYVYQEQ